MCSTVHCQIFIQFHATHNYHTDTHTHDENFLYFSVHSHLLVVVVLGVIE